MTTEELDSRWPEDQHRLDEALHAREVMKQRLGTSTIPSLDQYSEAIIHSIRTGVVTRLYRDWTPFFGRLDTDRTDEESGESRTYIGPYAVHAPDDNRLLIQSWRAPNSAAFYEATAEQPLDVVARRRYASDGRYITGVVTEDLARGIDDKDSLRRAIVGQVLQTRTGSMQDIMTTITPEQHRVIRTDAPVTVLQGGPGTGKTAVGLHRIAYLLFSQREMAALIIGPSARFISYVGQVLPALGEDSVGHMTLGQLGEDPTSLRLAPSAPRHLIGNARMAELLEAHAWAQLRPAGEPLVVKVRDRRTTLRPDVLSELVAQARTRDDRYGLARQQFQALLVAHVAAALQRRLGLLPSSDVVMDIARSRDLGKVMSAVWPALTPTVLLRTALADADLVNRHYPEDPSVVRSVRGTTKARPADSLLTALEELAGEVLGAEFTGRRYAHVVVDEAQELTAVELRMVKRRLTASGHLTLLGDLAQQMGTPHTDSWERLASQARLKTPDVRTLDVSYRVPADLLALAGPFSPDPDLVPQGVRQSLSPARVMRSDDPLGEALAEAAGFVDETVGIIVTDDLAATVEGSSAAVVDAGEEERPAGLAAGHSLVPLSESRGLEFGHVIVVEPADLLAQGGPGGLYIALTRAVKSLSIIHQAPLPAALAERLSIAGDPAPEVTGR